MGSEIFNLKSLYLEDTVVRGARVSTNNASSTRSIEVNPGDDPVVRTGETGVNKEYLIKSSLVGNDLNGYGTFTQNSDVVRGYTGAQNLYHSDRIRLDGDQKDYTVTGINGTKIYLIEKYSKEDISEPDINSGTCSIVKTKLDSVTYEKAMDNILYDKNKGEWGVTGIQMSNPIIAPSNSFEFDTGVTLQFQKGTSNKKPDIATVLSTKKTLISNNSSPVFDVSLSPLPYPHSSLQVLMGLNGKELHKAVEGEEYIVNYTDGPDILYPIPPYEEREVAYLKFLSSMDDEVQVESIDASFTGNMTIDKETDEGGTLVVRPVQDILSEEGFSIKVGGSEKVRNSEYISNDGAGIATFVEHNNREDLIDVLAYPKKLIWDGISVIRGVKEEDVNDFDNLVIPGVSGLDGIDHTVFFEDTDSNNLIRDIDFVIDPESGAFNLSSPTKDDETVLVSYYVEGDDIKDEKVELDRMRLNSFPLINGSIVLTEKYRKISDSGSDTTLTKILVEGIDFNVSYVTGYIDLIPSNDVTIEIKATYTPMAQINCIVRSIPNSLNYTYTIVDDVLSFSQDDIGGKRLIFTVSNPVVSVPKKILFEEDRVDSNYNFLGSINPEDILSIKIKGTGSIFNVQGAKYDDLIKGITLDSSLNDLSPFDGDIVVGTYTYESDILPYAPALLIYTTIEAGDTFFLIEGYDKTDILKAGIVIKVENRDPQSVNYYVIKSASYQNQSTKVYIFGSFPETAVDPVFSVFDDQIIWGSLSEDVSVDTSSPIDSESIVFNGGPLFLNTNFKIGGLLLANSQNIHTITSVSSKGDQTTVGIYPVLRFTLTSNIKFSELPIYSEGVTTLPAKKLIINDVGQPSFTLWYNSPDGFEGSAKVLFVEDKITIVESISGVKNPIPYEFFIDDFQDIYVLAKTIQATQSTFFINAPDMGVPAYNPFTIAHMGIEEYYLGDGVWSPSTIIPFEDETYVSLPYTFNVTPELFRYTLVELFSGKSDFTIKGADVTRYFTVGTVLTFINKISNRLFFSRVNSTELISETDTKVMLSSTSTENMVAPYMYSCFPPKWVDVTSTLISVDHDSSRMLFSGLIKENVRVGTLLNIGEGYIYQVREVTQNGTSFEVEVNSEIDPDVTVENYSGYVKTSSIPVSLTDPGPQPYIKVNYTIPETHVGYASVKVNISEIFIKEVVDNFNTKETILKFSDYETFGELFEAINAVESYVGGKTPYNVVVLDTFSVILKDKFDNYAFRSTGGEYVSLPGYLYVAVSAFDLDYSIPSGYGGVMGVKVTSSSISIRESVSDLYANELEKETTIIFNDTANLSDLASRIERISSVVSDFIFPFVTVLKNQGTFGLGKWDTTHIINNRGEYLFGDQVIYGIVDASSFVSVGILNEKKMGIDTDYTIEGGVVELNDPIASLERYTLNYMGLDNLYENEGDSIICSCRFITALPEGYRLDVYMEYINIDQFYMQKLTERYFSEIVTVPQIEQIVEQKGSSGGQGNDSGAANDLVLNYQGGLGDIYYLLQDEYIKKQLYLRFYKWYKQRLRCLSAELQLGIGFKFGHSNAVGEVGNYYSIDDQYVENEDYTLTKDDDIAQIDNGYSKFFPVGYNGQAPDYYNRFGKEYLSFNEMYCCNVTYRNDDGDVVTVGIIKSDRPYWNKTSDLIFKVWEDEYIDENLVGFYQVSVPEGDRSFAPSNYTFLKVIDSGDKVKIDNFKNYYTISNIVSPPNKTYEYIETSKPFTDRGIKTYNIVDNALAPFDTFIDNLPPDGYRIWIKRPDKENFPMSDDYGSLGATAYGESVEGLVKDSRKIKKPFFASLIKLFFPSAGSSSNFKIMVKRDSEASWEELGSIDLSNLTFKEERNIDDVMDALRYDFTEKFTVPIIPSVTIYDIEEDSNKGFFRYFYLAFEKVYDANSEDGYYHSVVLRAKNRNWWFKIVNGGESPIIGDYGFSDEKVYENFYDPDNIYKRLLLEKQAWQTEELIVRDLYDYNDKLARAFNDGDLNVMNTRYQGYLAMPEGGAAQGISDVLRTRIPAYEKQLRFLVDTTGPVFRTLYPDLVHAEDSASSEIATTYNQTLFAWNLYNAFYGKLGFYTTLNENNNYVWKTDYIKWVMSLERGVIYQELAKRMYEGKSRTLTVGLSESPTIQVSLTSQSVYTVVDPLLTVSSNYDGKYIHIIFNLIRNGNPDHTILNVSLVVYLFNKNTVEGRTSVIYKSISEVCSEISNYSYEGVKLFLASDVFGYYENNVLPKTVHVNGQLIDPVEGFSINTTNVVDHRASDPRILYINRKIEDRIYTHEIRSVPSFNIKYVGNFYDLEYSNTAFNLYDTNTPYYKISYLVSTDTTGLTQLLISTDEYQSIVIKLYKIDEIGNITGYKTFEEVVEEINNYGTEYYNTIQADLVYSNGEESCALLKESTYEISNQSGQPLDVIFDLNTVENDTAYYRVGIDELGNEKLFILFYTIVKSGSTYLRTNDIEKVFEFSFKSAEGSYKTITELCSEISSYQYLGEELFGASSLYEPDPQGALSTTYIVISDVYLPVNQDSGSIVYADVYTESLGKTTNIRNVEDLKNAEFSFPMYTANGNPRKTIIEDIPVSGKWEATNDENVVEISCVDGESWEVTFSDTSSGDYKSYMTPDEIQDLIKRDEVLTQEQYLQIQRVEDRPTVPVIKELVLTRISGGTRNELRINLREYSTIFELVDVITTARFNDDGDHAVNGTRQFFSASLIGNRSVEGEYKSYELDSYYNPIVESFAVKDPLPGYPNNISYKNNHVIGWNMAVESLGATEKHKLSMSSRRYSRGQTYQFTMNDPETAYTDTLYNNPQGFRRDILAFDVYSWDSNGHYEIRDNWMYFKSDSVDYSMAADLGQPDKTLGYGIPLAGSGHRFTHYRESLLDLVNRINNNDVVNKWFYVNLKFTRNNSNDPGYFEYNYLPNYYSEVPRSETDQIMLRDDNVLEVAPGDSYKFTASNVAIDGVSDTIDLSCDWEFDYTYNKTFFFNEVANRTVDDLTDSINNDFPPEIFSSIIEAEFDPDGLGLSGAMSRGLLPSFIEETIGVTGIDLKMYVGTSPTRTSETAIRLKIRTAAGSNFIVKNATYVIPRTRDRITITCDLTYFDTYTLSGYSLDGFGIGALSDFISSIRPYGDSIFTSLFSSVALADNFREYYSGRLITTSKEISITGTLLKAMLSDITAFKVLNMAPEATLRITGSSVDLVTFKTYNQEITGSVDVPDYVESIKGNYTTGFLSCDVLPLVVPSTTYGGVNPAIYNLTSNNIPAHVYFGVMGDIKFIQISDQNLHVQYNYIKERLGMPWTDSDGNIEYDYYTPETYNENNPCAIDLSNFLGYLRTGRYNQIKDSLENEATISDKYFWLYMKFHKEFGCDQRVNMMKDAIEKGNTDIETLNQIL